MDYLDELRIRRQELAWLDAGVADVAANRAAKGRLVGTFKATHGDGRYDPSQEQDVLGRYKDNFMRRGLPPELEEIYGMAALMATRGVRDGDADYVSDAIRRLREVQERKPAEVVSSP